MVDKQEKRLREYSGRQEAKDMYSKVLAARVHMLKETMEGVEIMCEELQELYDEGVKEGEVLKAKRSALLLSKKGTALESRRRSVSC